MNTTNVWQMKQSTVSNVQLYGMHVVDLKISHAIKKVTLPKTTSQSSHHLVTKLFYLSRKSRQDILTAVAFLCTRVQSPDKDDYKKLARVMQ